MTFSAIVVGCGRIGSEYSFQTTSPGVHSHAQAYFEHPQTNLVGVVDISEAAVKRAEFSWRCRGSTNAVELINELKPDIVSICTPDHTHATLACEILEKYAPKLLFMEKPLATSKKEAKKILALAQLKGTSLGVNFTRRYTPIYQILKNELRSGIHGKPLRARVLYSKGLAHAGSHALDLLRFWIGEAQEVNHRKLSAWGPNGDSSLSADILFEGNVSASIEGFDDRCASVFEVEIFTEKTRWILSNGGTEWRFFEARHGELFPEYREYFPTGRERKEPSLQDEKGALFYAVENIVAHLQKKSPLICDGAEGLATIELIEKIRK